MLSPQLQSDLITTVENCYAKAESKLNRTFPRPQVLFNQRGKIAGSALLQKNTLKFHPAIYQQNIEHFLYHVVPHEIAHLLVWQIYGKTAPHGREWQQMMINVFECPPHRTHQYNIDDIGIKHFDYFCDCGEVKLTIRRHNKVLKGAIYRCRRCGNDLQIKTA